MASDQNSLLGAGSAKGVDASIPLMARAPAQPDPMGQFGQYVGLANALQQNKLLGINQQRGEIGIQQDRQALQRAQQDQTIEFAKFAYGQTAALAADPGTTPEKVAQTAQMLGTMPGAPPGLADHIIGIMPTDQAAVQPFLRQQLAKTEASLGRIGVYLNGTPTLVDNGSQKQWQAVNPNPGTPGYGVTPLPGGTFSNTLSPGQKATPVPTIANGQPGTIPLGTTVDSFGNPLQGGAQPPQPSAMGTGRYAPPQPPGGQPQQAAATPPGFVPTGLPAGADQQIRANQDAFNAAQADVPQAVNRIAGLQKAYRALSLINTGPGTGKWQELRSTLQSLPVINGLLKPDFGEEDSIANYDSARKFMQEYANRSTIGSTAQGLQASQHANASTDITQGASADVLRTNIGLERMAMAQTQAAKDPQAYLGDASKFAADNDRRAFAADMYSPSQLKTLVGGMKPAERTKFFTSLSTARSMGMIQAPGQ